MIWVVDVSVAAKWFAPDGDRSDAAAERILRAIAQNPEPYVVPELFFHELLSVLCRRMRQARDVSASFERTARLGLRRVRLDDVLARRAAKLAFDYRLSGYDACYAAVAFVLGGKWLTFDAAAHGRIEPLGISILPE